MMFFVAQGICSEITMKNHVLAGILAPPLVLRVFVTQGLGVSDCHCTPLISIFTERDSEVCIYTLGIDNRVKKR